MTRKSDAKEWQCSTCKQWVSDSYLVHVHAYPTYGAETYYVTCERFPSDLVRDHAMKEDRG